MLSVEGRATFGGSRTGQTTSALSGGNRHWCVALHCFSSRDAACCSSPVGTLSDNHRQSGPIYLTPEELATYDGSDPDKPLYLAINHTIYDVSNGRHIYGPGGSYQYFGGCDAARAYVTGCFAEDTTPDMRGVEEMFLPIDDPETDKHWPATELLEMKKKEKEEAEEKTYKALKHWVDFFADSHKYHHVGYVKLDDDWLEKTPKRDLCERAKKGRKKRKIPKGEKN